MPDLPIVNNIPSGILPGSQPFGSDRDLQVQQQLALIKQLQAQADLETANADKAKTAARLADPLEAAHAAQSVQDFATRKDVGIPVTDPTTIMGIRAAQPQTTPFGTSTQVKGIRSVGTAPTMTETRSTAEEMADPNYATVQAGLRDQAQMKANAAAGSGLADVKEAVTGMKEGTLPPMMPGRATKEYLSTMAEAHRQGFDLSGAATDWAATQKHVATLNGPQQTRLNQSINALPDLLDSVESLSAQWKGGQFPLLNKATLAAAKGGALGKQAATIANKLDAQIADVNADLGSVYMGGNTPTDQALGLAAKALSSDWDQTVLDNMVQLARSNVKIRANSIKHTGVQGASAGNPYDKGASAATPASDPYQDYLNRHAATK